MTKMIDIFESYQSARKHFISKAQQQELSIEGHTLPNHLGIDGETLSCDIASPSHQKHNTCLIVSSGVHGIEGYCGSGIQQTLLGSRIYQEISQHVDVHLVHAVNPYGFSHGSRVNEGNIDLNRNFIDFTEKKAPWALYEEYRSRAYPHNWQDVSLQQVFDILKQVERDVGIEKMQAITTHGQHDYPQDLFYGGDQPAWSTLLWQSYIQSIVTNYDFIIHIDLHTGLGLEGDCQAIYTGLPELTDKVTLAQQWLGYNAVIIPGTQDSISASIDGTLGSYIDKFDVTSISVALEFGTQPIDKIIQTLAMDCWLKHNPQADKLVHLKIKQALREAFLVDSPSWRKAVWEHTEFYLKRLLDGFKTNT